MSDKNATIVTEQLSQLSAPDGSINHGGLWKVKKRIFPRPTDPPMAKKDSGGNLVTAPLPLKNLYIETYKNGLAHRQMKSEYTDIFELKSLLWKLRYENATSLPPGPWPI